MSKEKEVAEKKNLKVKPEPLIYVGPTLLGVANHNTVFHQGLPKEIQIAIEKEPAFKNLLIPIRRLALASDEIANQRGAIYTCYKKVLNYPS